MTAETGLPAPMAFLRLFDSTASSGITSTLTHGPYAITGGLGGLGLRAAKMLVESGASGVVLSSRSGRSTGLVDVPRVVSTRQ